MLLSEHLLNSNQHCWNKFNLFATPRRAKPWLALICCCDHFSLNQGLSFYVLQKYIPLQKSGQISISGQLLEPAVPLEFSVFLYFWIWMIEISLSLFFSLSLFLSLSLSFSLFMTWFRRVAASQVEWFSLARCVAHWCAHAAALPVWHCSVIFRGAGRGMQSC